jgi:signal transduction histidine kinase
VVVRADRRRVAQVLGNLLANAVEHGTGTVSLRGLRRGATVVLEVVDEGPAERQPPPAGSGGRGRGLGIAARAVEEAGGRLEVVGGPEGTTASVELPAVGP